MAVMLQVSEISIVDQVLVSRDLFTQMTDWTVSLLCNLLLGATGTVRLQDE